MENSRLLYRYMSFEMFVNMMQKRALTLVLPELWRDPTEKICFDRIIDRLNDFYSQVLIQIIKWQTYCQSWTTLNESDAMWRIYSFNDMSVQISAYENELVRLNDNLISRDVVYSNEEIVLPDMNESKGREKNLGQLILSSLTRKRTPFSHEKEVRLIFPLKMNKAPNICVADYWIAFCSTAINDSALLEDLLSINHTINPDDRDQCMQLLNIGENRKETIDIPFSNFPDLIQSVKVNPFAPSWFVETVKTFCEHNSIPFAGQSTLYS